MRVGLDVGKQEHFAHVLDDVGDRLFSRSDANDQAAIEVVLDRACARRDALAAEIQEAFLARPFGELPASMPGIGRRTGARILAEIGDGSAFYDRKRAEGKRHNATLICLARRCCDVILAILRTGQAARAARHAELADVA